MATKEEKQRKQFAEKLLRIKGVDYDKWLDEKHQVIIQENQDLVMKALEIVLDNNEKPNVSKNHSTSNKSSSTEDVE